MITKKTVIDQIEIIRNGTIQIRFAKLVLEDDKEISSQWHRTSIEPGGDVDFQLQEVNKHLALMGNAEVTDDGIKVEQLKAIKNTLDVIAEK